MHDRPPGSVPPARPSRWLPWALRALRLYPSAWRTRYGPEMADVLAQYRVTGRTCLDLLRGALDGWLTPGLTERVLPMRTVRSVPWTIFATFAAFSAAFFLPFVIIADPDELDNVPTGYGALAAGVPVLRAGTVAMQFGFLVALVAMLVGLVVLTIGAGRRAVGARHWPTLLGATASLLVTAAVALQYVRPPHRSGLADVGTVCSPTACTVGPGIALFVLAFAAGILGVLLVVTLFGRRGRDSPDTFPALARWWWRIVVVSSAVAILAMAVTLIGTVTWGLTVWLHADHLTVDAGGKMLVAVTFAASALVMATLTAVAATTFGRSVVAFAE